MTNPASEAVEALREEFRGTVIRPSDSGYDEARRIWYAMIDPEPAIIARCAGTADVITAVNVARERDHLVSVKGSGHYVAGNAVCDDGIVIDCSQMNAIRVDPDLDEDCIAWARDLYEEMTQYASGGTNRNFISEATGEEQLAYRENHDRLVRIKNEWDPGNLFRMNQNVQPTG